MAGVCCPHLYLYFSLMNVADQLGCAVDLLKRMPPKDISANLEATLELAPDIIEDLLASVDQPLKEMLDTSCNRPFLIYDYNRYVVSIRRFCSSCMRLLLLHTVSRPADAVRQRWR